MTRLAGFGDNLKVAIFGASGGIGGALTEALADAPNVDTVFAISRQRTNGGAGVSPVQCLEYTDETIARLADDLPDLDIIICALGILHTNAFGPEKSRRNLSLETMQQVFHVNTFLPSLIAKQMLPKMKRDSKSVFAALSARVGSISDNRLGGWYSYRASKAALNMMIKTMAIEHARRFKQASVIGLHPGTVNTQLSKPFQTNVAKEKLFDPDFSAARLLDVIEKVTPAQTGKIFAWDGVEILP